ncbi:MAG TPA: LysR family transcriptional regulator [Polyangiaceae bacterium]
MDKLKAMRTFVAIADENSLTGAARALDTSLPSVVRVLAGLEAELGVRLFQRTTRRIAITDAGRRYLLRCREALSVVDEAEAELRAEQSEPRGRLSITAPVLFGQRHVVGAVVTYLELYPKVVAELHLLDRVVNLVDEGHDIGIRIGALEDSSLIAQQVGSMPRLTVAAPSYLRAHGTPAHPRDLHAHNCVRFWRAGSSNWTFSVDGKALSIPVRGNLSVNQSAAAAEACARGLGIGTFFGYQVMPYVASGALRVVLSAFEPPPQPIHVVYPEAKLVPARTRVFIDFIKRHLAREQAAWQRKARSRK